MGPERSRRRGLGGEGGGPDAAMDTSNVAARNPLTGELDSGRVSDSDSLDGEVWGADMNPFDGEAWAGLDDPE